MRIDSAGWTHVGRRGARPVGARSAAVAHVGDSRLYRLREGRLEALTRDHSMLEQGRAAGVAEALVQEAYAAGGRDNISAIVVGGRSRACMMEKIRWNPVGEVFKWDGGTGKWEFQAACKPQKPSTLSTMLPPPKCSPELR
jgi:hypothetical protein